MVNKALENHSFAFLLNLSEMNDNLGGRHFGDVEAISPIWEFMKLLSRGLINNSYLKQYNITPDKRKIKRKKEKKWTYSYKATQKGKINGN